MAQKLTESGFEVGTFRDWLKSGIPDVAVAVVVEHYAFDAGERCTPQAIAAFRSFAAIGIRAWIQKELNWQPPSDVSKFIDSHILREARSWECVFDRRWIAAAENCTGWKWSQPCMRHLINLVVYNRLPVEVRQSLDEFNPVLETGHRARKQHQHFSSESVEQVLRMQIEIARSLLMVSTSWKELKENSRRRFEGMSQLKLLN
ncbi:MAG TPA: P63C domain-containing protein [Coleofasciculaceae cyanobacterium]